VSKYIAILILCFIGLSSVAQTEESQNKKKPITQEKTNDKSSFVVKKALLDKSISNKENKGESVVIKKPLLKNNSISNSETNAIMKMSKPHSPALAWKLSLVLPGLGQIYNGQWWKVPIIYAGIGGAIYGMSWNMSKYNDYKYAFSDYVEYINQIVPEGQDRVSVNSERWKKVYVDDVNNFDTSQEEWFKNALKNRKDSFKRNRDLTIIAAVGVYALNIIDALVAAHFYDFDLSDDLSMGVRPSVNYNNASGNSLGIACSIRF